MKVNVDLSLCQSHGQCVLAADQVFRLDDELNLHYNPEPRDEFRAVSAVPHTDRMTIFR